jgi:hypothetical protein
MGPPSSNAPPGMSQMNASLPPKPTGMPASFQPPPNMAHINFNAPVIRLGTAVPAGGMGATGGRGPNDSNSVRRGLGMENNSRPRDALVPPTREEVFRSIFIGKIPVSLTDGELERILRAAGSLRKWTRAIDASAKPCTFGFAEYEDAESLETAIEVLPGVEVPATKVEIKQEGGEANGEVEKTRLLVQIDDASRKYSDEWREKRGDDESAVQFRIDTARENLGSVLAGLFNPSDSNLDGEGDAYMQDYQNAADPATGEIITIPLTAGEDELADIPPEMRETVSAEIAAFRDRSTRRDLERLRREEEIEAADRRAQRAARSSPPISAPTGPSGGTNGIPLGPRGAPSGPKGFQNGTNATSSGTSYITQEEEESDASDEELERRKQEKRQADKEKSYLDYERRWLNRERARTAAIDREKARDDDETSHLSRKQQNAAQRLREFNDDTEQSRRNEEYYRDKSAWLRNRNMFRSREKEFDDRDRAAEDRENARDVERKEYSRELADSFLDRQAEELSARAVREPQRLKISLGAAAQRVQAAAPRRTVAEVEGLLEDEEEVDTTKRTLIPIKFENAAEAAGLNEEERKQAARQLAQDIPTDKEGLWAWNVQWDYVDDAIVNDQIRPFVEKKMVEYLGVLEEMLVDVVEEHIKKRGTAEELVSELEGVSHNDLLFRLFTNY